MKKIIVTFFTSLFLCQFSFATKTKVTKEELEEASHPVDKSANASILEESIDITYAYNQNDGFSIKRKVYGRIKIYKKEGLDYAVRRVRLWKTKTEEETISKLKAHTYNLIDGVIEESSMKKDAVFKDETAPDRNTMKFTLPNVVKGSVIEFSYVITSPYYTYFPTFYFQEAIPMKKIKLNVEIPEYFNYGIQTRGDKNIKLSEGTKRDRITFRQVYTVGSGTGTFERRHTSQEVEFMVKTYSLNLNNIEAYKKESYVSNVYNYLPCVEFDLKSIKYPRSSIKYYSNTWEDVLKKYINGPVYQKEVSKTNYYKKDLQKILEASSTEASKIDNIFSFVKNNMGWNGVNSNMAYNGVRSAYVSGSGSSGQINTILLSMLKEANINARPVFVSSVDKPKSIYPSYTAFDYMVVEVVMSDNSKYYLDATDKNLIPGMLPERVIKGEGKVLTSSGKVIDINLRPQSSTVNKMLTYSIDQKGNIEGKIRNRVKGYESYLYRKNTNDKNDEVVEKMTKDYNFSEVTLYKRDGVSDLYKDVNFSYNFKMDEFSTVVEDEIYFQPLLFLRTVNNPFKIDERKFPIDLGNAVNNMYMVSIAVPEGYEVVSLPQSIKIGLPNDLASFNMIVTHSNNKIELRVTEKWPQPFIAAESYPLLKEFMKKLIEKENEQITLKKI